MKAKSIFETINFRRGLDPKQALQVGRYSPEEMEKERKNFCDVLENDYGIFAEFDEGSIDNMWVLRFHNISTIKNEFDGVLGNPLVFYSPYPEDFYETAYKDIEKPKTFLHPWIFINKYNYEMDKNASEFLTFNNEGELIKKILEEVYSESEKWDYPRILKNRINLLNP